ncbi:MAG TPA: PilZ domain-containing protein [Pseudomonas sp.]|nr:PilZ domain-containing protein [Pseudomonas sp.]
MVLSEAGGNRRGHPRTPLRWEIRVWHESFGERSAHTRDFSAVGIYIELRELTCLPVGTRLKAQIQGLPTPAPVLEMEIRRTDERGAGLLYVLD